MRQPRLFEHRPPAIGQSRAEPALELSPRDALGRVLGMQVEGSPLDLRAEPTLEPRRPFEADVAEGSYVVAPDRDLRDRVDCFGHGRHSIPVGENVAMGPETRYALSGDIHIAYQLVGDGPFDLVFVPGFVTHMELQWTLPGFADFLSDLGAFSRLIRFDKRGTGMSDPVSGAPSLETRMDDVRAVMDAVGSRRAAFYGLSEGGAMSILFAATYPERTAALVIRSCSPRTLWAPDFPWGRSEDAYQREVDQALGVYASRPEAREAVRALGMRDEDEVEAFIDYVRYGASPGMLSALYRMNKEIDVRDVLPTVRVPTLVLHGSEDELVPIEAAKFMAQRLPSARLVELPGVGHMALKAGGTKIQTELQRFLDDVWHTGGWEETEADRMLATVLFTDIVDSTMKATELGDRSWRELLERHNALTRRELLRFRGREIDTTGDGFLAAFDGPARAIRCASAVVEGVHELGLSIRAGLHTGECEVADGKVAGIAVHTGARVAAQATADEVLVSSTVKDLVAGSGIRFRERGLHELKGIPGRWQLFAVDGEA
jgi:pimeloyl-ACP methyl ester carboxylesterase/class 3 adenylate cyclase